MLKSDNRENPASTRLHDSRTCENQNENAICNPDLVTEPPQFSDMDGFRAGTPHAAKEHAATEERNPAGMHLLTVRDVAELLRVPVSWVYGRLRARSLHPLPAYRLGKYWRFEEKEILAWVKHQHEGHHVA